MSEGNRGIIVACLAGLALISASAGFYWATLNRPKEQRYQPYRYTSDKPQEMPAFDRKPYEYREPCHDPKWRDESELCAEWRSAKAGEDSATWAKWGFGATVIGIFGLLASITQNRIALDRAREANDLARDTARRQLRAYVSWDEVTLSHQRDGEGKFISSRLQVNWKNGGQTPARGVVTDVNWRLLDDVPGDRFRYERGDLNEIHPITVGPQGSVTSAAQETFAREIFDLVASRDKRVFMWAFAEYTDVFGEARRTELCAEMLVTPLGNGQYNMRFESFGPFNGSDEECGDRLRTGVHAAESLN